MLAHLRVEFVHVKCSALKSILKEQIVSIRAFDLLDGKLAANDFGSKLSKNEGSCNSMICEKKFKVNNKQI